MYLVKFYGGDDEDKKFRVRKRAKEYLRRKAKKWCVDNDVDPDEVDCFTDDYFYYGVEECGAYIVKLYEIPEFNNEIEELLWNAKLAMDEADFAAEDYKWSLEECGVSDCVYAAKENIDKALKLIKERV